MEFILATQNQHKLKEFNELFDRKTIKVVSPERSLDVEETGQTYHENAFLKAKAYFLEFNSPSMADDSGLDVEALPGLLGIYSARFGGEGLNDRDRCELLLEKLEGQLCRKAIFTCVLCFYFSHEQIFFFEGKLKGDIGFDLRGEDGFGYDPIFIPDGAALGEALSMNSQWKKEHSHRALASMIAQKFFAQRICQNYDAYNIISPSSESDGA